MGYCYFKSCCTEMAPVFAVTWNIAFQTRNGATWNSVSQLARCRIYEPIQDKRRGKNVRGQLSSLLSFEPRLPVIYFYIYQRPSTVSETMRMVKRMLELFNHYF